MIAMKIITTIHFKSNAVVTVTNSAATTYASGRALARSRDEAVAPDVYAGGGCGDFVVPMLSIPSPRGELSSR
jgi:hypothetical protein